MEGNELNQFINLPYHIMKDKRLSQTQKMIYGFVNGFDEPLICYASNTYIAEVIGVSARAVSKAISYLIKNSYLKAFQPNGRSRSLVVLKTPPEAVKMAQEASQELTDEEYYANYMPDPNSVF